MSLDPVGCWGGDGVGGGVALGDLRLYEMGLCHRLGKGSCHYIERHHVV